MSQEQIDSILRLLSVVGGLLTVLNVSLVFVRYDLMRIRDEIKKLQ